MSLIKRKVRNNDQDAREWTPVAEAVMYPFKIQPTTPGAKEWKLFCKP